MNKNKGFTLIELIAVITLIAVLSLLVVPTIIGLVNENKPKISSTTKELVYSATGAYLDANQTEYKRVLNSIMTSPEREVIVIEYKGRELTLTPDHRVLTTRGYIEAQDLLESDELIISKNL